MEELVKFMYHNIRYAEFNTKSDDCMICGFNGEIQLAKIGDDLVWKCPQCSNTDEAQMSVVRRTCGYIGSNYWNKGKTKEINERQLHL